jgi:hypothetical protein
VDTSRQPADSVGLPRPEGWAGKRPSTRLILSLTFLSLVAVGCGVGAASALLSGRPGVGLLLAAGTVYIASVAGLGSCALWTPRQPGPTAELAECPACHDHNSVSFGYSTWPYFWMTAAVGLSVVVAIVAAVAIAMAGPAGLAIGGVVLVLAAALAWFLVVTLRLAPGRLALCTNGVYHRGLTSTYFVPWHAIAAVTAEWTSSPLIVAKAYASADTKLRRYTGRFGTQETQFLPFLAVPARWLATDPNLVYHVLAFYHRHEDRRAELGTNAALGRINQGAIQT